MSNDEMTQIMTQIHKCKNTLIEKLKLLFEAKNSISFGILIELIGFILKYQMIHRIGKINKFNGFVLICR